MGEVLQTLTGRSLERPVSFPDALFFRGRAEDGAACLATIDRRWVLLSRPVAGLACRIRIGVGQFQAVTVVVRDDRHALRLMHRDPGLSIDLAEVPDLETAEAACDCLADFLDLPALTLAGRSGSGELIVSGAVQQERRVAAGRARRSRFATRRKTGEVVEFRKLSGREIIARN